MPRIIFINRFFYPDHSATSQMLSDIAFALADGGQQVAVITSRTGYDGDGSQLAARETINGIAVRRVWSSSFGRHAALGRICDYVTFYVSAMTTLMLLARREDIIVAKTDPPMLSVLAAPIARLKGARLVNWLQDVFPEVAEALGVGTGAGAALVYGLLRRLRNASLRAADCNVVLGGRMAAKLASLGVAKPCVRISANWADGNIVQPKIRETNALRREWDLADKFVVGYSGNLGRAHEFQTLLEAMALLERTAPARAGVQQIAWLFIGGGVNQAALMQEVASRGLTSVSCRPYQPRERLGESLSVPDVHLVTLRPVLEGLIVPSKIYGVLAAGRPTIFIGDAEGEVARLLAGHGCGLTVGEGDGQGLAAAILDLAASPAACAQMGANARAAFDTDYDMPHAVARWQALIADLSAQQASPSDTMASKRL